jgi:hypothetical protein
LLFAILGFWSSFRETQAQSCESKCDFHFKTASCIQCDSPHRTRFNQCVAECRAASAPLRTPSPALTKRREAEDCRNRCLDNEPTRSRYGACVRNCSPITDKHWRAINQGCYDGCEIAIQKYLRIQRTYCTQYEDGSGAHSECLGDVYKWTLNCNRDCDYSAQERTAHGTPRESAPVEMNTRIFARSSTAPSGSSTLSRSSEFGAVLVPPPNQPIDRTPGSDGPYCITFSVSSAPYVENNIRFMTYNMTLRNDCKTNIRVRILYVDGSSREETAFRNSQRNLPCANVVNDLNEPCRKGYLRAEYLGPTQ